MLTAAAGMRHVLRDMGAFCESYTQALTVNVFNEQVKVLLGLGPLLRENFRGQLAPQGAKVLVGVGAENTEVVQEGRSLASRWGMVW